LIRRRRAKENVSNGNMGEEETGWPTFTALRGGRRGTRRRKVSSKILWARLIAAAAGVA